MAKENISTIEEMLLDAAGIITAETREDVIEATEEQLLAQLNFFTKQIAGVIPETVGIEIKSLEEVRESFVENDLLTDGEITYLSRKGMKLVAIAADTDIELANSKNKIRKFVFAKKLDAEVISEVIQNEITAEVTKAIKETLVDTINLSGTDKIHVSTTYNNVKHNVVSLENIGMELNQRAEEKFSSLGFIVKDYTKEGQGVNKDIDYKYQEITSMFGSVKVFAMKKGNSLIAKIKKGDFSIIKTADLNSFQIQMLETIANVLKSSGYTVHFEGKTPKNTETVLEKYSEKSSLFAGGTNSNNKVKTFEELKNSIQLELEKEERLASINEENHL